jgi:peroxiredoxin
VVLLALAGAAPAAPKVGDTAPDFTLSTLDERAVRLQELRAGGPVALVVLRGYPGYQCPACTAQVQDLIRHAAGFKAAGVRVVLVYPGPADGLKRRADEFTRDKAIPDPLVLVTDPDYALVNAYGLRWDAPRETAYPSTFVIGADGKVRFARVSKSHGGRVKAEEILGAVR